MSITNWTRLEPDTQTNVLDVDLAEGVTARLADPLWMLGRQWQMGELTGEDAASPVVAHLEASSYALTSVVAGDAAPVPYDVDVHRRRGADRARRRRARRAHPCRRRDQPRRAAHRGRPDHVCDEGR